MSKQLWSDNDIEQVGAIVGRDGMMGLYVHFPIVKNIRNAYERELATRNEMIGNLQNDLGKKQAYIAEQEKIILSGAQMYHAERALREQAQARITELEAEVKRLTDRNSGLSAAIDGCAGQWTPMPEGAHYCGCSEEDCTGEWRIENNGSRLVIGDGESELSIEFYEAIRVCWQVQPSINA